MSSGARRHFFEVEGHRLAYEAYGQGDEVFIFLHGVTGSMAGWRGFMEPFCRRGRVFLLTLPGHHPAAFPPGYAEARITAEAWGDLGGRAVAALTGGRPATLIGHSTGGFWALAIAWRAPEIVARAVSLSGFAWGRWGAFLGLQQRLLLKLGQSYQPVFAGLFRAMNGAAALASRRWRGPESTVLPGASLTQRSLVESEPDVRQLDMGAMAQIFRAMYRQVDLRPYLGEIKAPVLAVTGENDPFVPPPQARTIAAGVPDGMLAAFPGGHLVMLERPEAVQAAILAWLDQHPVSSGAEGPK